MDVAGGWGKWGQVLAGLGQQPPHKRGGLRLGTVRAPGEPGLPAPTPQPTVGWALSSWGLCSWPRLARKGTPSLTKSKVWPPPHALGRVPLPTGIFGQVGGESCTHLPLFPCRSQLLCPSEAGEGLWACARLAWKCQALGLVSGSAGRRLGPAFGLSGRG